MADVDTELPERKQRKSVAFSEGTTLIDPNGEVTNMANGSDETTAQSHTNGDAAVDEATASFDDLALKKKKKKSSKTKEAEKEDEPEEPTAEAEFDPTALKKKKKKKPVKDEGDFEAKLAEAGAGDKPEEDEAKEAEPQDTGDMDKGTGIWAHDETRPIAYKLLLDRFFHQLNAHNPDLATGGLGRSHKIPPPQCLREGNKKTIFANISEICKRMKRTEEHVTLFLFAELGTTGSTDGSRRLVIKGKFMQKQIENVLRRYIVEYVTCKTCRSPDTELLRGENRLFFINCNSCGSRRSVVSIKTGFSAQIGKRRRMQG